MSSISSLTRREMLKKLGAGAALASLGMVSASKAVAGAVKGKRPIHPFVLPALHYGFNALEPFIDARTMEIHHDKHHQGYVNNANAALSGYPELQALTAGQLLSDLGEVPSAIRKAVRNNVGGHANHTLFWTILSPNSTGLPKGKLAMAITRDFGDFSSFQARFSEAAATRFGSGWAWLSVKADGLVIHSTANQDSPLSEGMIPVIGLDVWEHAYYLHYQNRRADYVKAFWSVVDWDQAEDNFVAAS